MYYFIEINVSRKISIVPVHVHVYANCIRTSSVLLISLGECSSINKSSILNVDKTKCNISLLSHYKIV